MPKDGVIRSALVERMNELNQLYPSTEQRFSLFFRDRKWNRQRIAIWAGRENVENWKSLITF